MEKRTRSFGTRNMTGARVVEARERLGMKPFELLAKLQVSGIDISSCTLASIEGQRRSLSDFELNALADILKVSVDWLLGRE